MESKDAGSHGRGIMRANLYFFSLEIESESGNSPPTLGDHSLCHTKSLQPHLGRYPDLQVPRRAVVSALNGAA
jgi:hypothetical protein